MVVKKILSLVIMSMLATWLVGCEGGLSGPTSLAIQSTGNPVEALSTSGEYPPERYARAEKPVPLVFPNDHGPHPDYQTEWWYYTGNLSTASGRRFGYQLTFFRRALIPADLRVERSSDWATDQVYMAHFALTDVVGGQHQSSERFSRGAAGLAGAQADPFHVWLEDWHVSQLAEGSYTLQAASGDIHLELVLQDQKGPALQGDQGYSQKGPEPGNASYYYSFTRLESQGTLDMGNQRFELSGYSWMDHEFSTVLLSAEQLGWDWFSIQLDDGTELMALQLRRLDGTVDPYSSGTFINEEAITTHLDWEAFSIQASGAWRSPRSGAVYPDRWQIQVPALRIDLQIQPLLADQELAVSYAYWEGAVRVTGTHGSNAVSGYGYVEMTGYSP